MLKNFFALFLGVVLAVGIVEISLRIYNPFHFRTKGDQIILPANMKMTIKNPSIPALDRTIVHTKNSLGFRGKEFPKAQAEFFKIFVVGGSTTECFYISDGKTWPEILGRRLQKNFEKIWLNNAGLDGHSTFGHIVLLKDYLIKFNPEMIVFLVGINDVGRNDLRKFDKSMIRNLRKTGSIFSSVASYSECINLLLNLYRNFKARTRTLQHGSIDLKMIDMVSISEKQQREILRHHESFRHNYKERLETLIELCRKNDIVPVLITQPALYGCETDPNTNIELSLIKVGKELNGCLAWEILETYNQITRSVGQEQQVLVIDLARNFPHDSRLFYDTIHFTNEGAEMVGELVFQDLYSSIRKQRQGR